MGKKLPTTPRSRARAAIRQLFLRSRERAACLKAAKNRCSKCGVKSSKKIGAEVKVHVHHKNGIKIWEEVLDLIFREILCAPELMTVLCVACHEELHHPKSEPEVDKNGQ